MRKRSARPKTCWPALSAPPPPVSWSPGSVFTFAEPVETETVEPAATTEATEAPEAPVEDQPTTEAADAATDSKTETKGDA